MVSIGLRIKELMSKEKIDAPTLASKLGKTKQAVYDMIEKQDLNTSILRQLSDIFNVPITFFLSEDKESEGKLDLSSEEIERLKREVKNLRQEVERLEKLKLPTDNSKALDVSMKFFEAAKEMFTYYHQMNKNENEGNK